MDPTTARTRGLFLTALIGGAFPCVGPLIGPPLALLAGTGELPPEAARWRARLRLLAVLDLLVLAALGALWPTLTREAQARKQGQGSGGALSLGVQLDPAEVPGGVRLAGVLPGSPAQDGGLAQGDLVLSVDGRPVANAQALRTEVQQSDGGTLELAISRAGEQRTARIRPVPAQALAGPRRALFEPTPGPALDGGSNQRLAVAFAAAAFLALWLFGRRKGATALPLWLLGVLVAASLSAVGAARALEALLGGSSAGSVLLAQTVMAATLALLGWVLLRKRPSTSLGVTGEGEPERPSTSLGVNGGGASQRAGREPWSSYAISVGLLAAFTVRVAMLVTFVARVVFQRSDDAGHPLVELAGRTHLGALGWGLLALSACVLAPLGEELLFRGLLLPWLRGWLPATASLVLSAAVFAALHPFYGPYVGWIFFLGLVLGYARVRSGGVTAPVLVHATINSVALVAAVLTRGL